jgi:hypothetical protein
MGLMACLDVAALAAFLANDRSAHLEQEWIDPLPLGSDRDPKTGWSTV